MDYHDDSPLYSARMRAARARDLMGEALDIAKWRLSAPMLRQDIDDKRRQITASIVAKPSEIARKHPAALASGAALLGLWLFRKPIAKALPHIAEGVREGAASLFDTLSDVRTNHISKNKD